MIVEMILAHLIGDYVLQTNYLACWKAQRLSGVLVHGTIVLVTTLAFSIARPDWAVWALAIGVAHIAIDATNFKVSGWLRARGFKSCSIFAGDQIAHFLIIGSALVLSGELQAFGDVWAAFADGGLMAIAVGYILLTMPAWVVIEFLVSGLVLGSPPDFVAANRHKYISILERGAMATLLLSPAAFIFPVATLPRMLMNRSKAHLSDAYVAEWLASMLMALVVGLYLRPFFI